jgi:signal peptidase
MQIKRKTVLNILLVALVLVIVGANLYTNIARARGNTLPMPFGIGTAVINSGSMEPKYMVGDLIYVKEVDVNSIKAGDDITFILNEDLVVATHQVVRVDAENQRFYTKGLANEIEDQDPVHFNNVIGVPQFSIPKLGYVSDFVQNPPGRYVTIAVCALLILNLFMGSSDSKKSKKEESDGEDGNTAPDTPPSAEQDTKQE